jgi:hypothetical protein
MTQFDPIVTPAATLSLSSFRGEAAASDERTSAKFETMEEREKKKRGHDPDKACFQRFRAVSATRDKYRGEPNAHDREGL